MAPMGYLFAVLALGLGLIAVVSLRAEQWVPAVAAAALTVWMASLSWGVLRRRR